MEMSITNTPLTGILIVEDKHNFPAKYQLLSTTEENEDADLWKDGIFRSKVKRYLCYTMDASAAQWNHVLTDIVLVGLKDNTPPGYTAVTETFDSHDQPLRKHLLCLKFLPRTSTSTAISDIILTKHDSYKAKQYTMFGEINGIKCCYKQSSIKSISNRPPPPIPSIQPQTVTPLRSPPDNPEKNSHPIITAKSSSNKEKQIIGIEGVPFKINDKFLESSQNSMGDDLNIKVKSESDLEIFFYDFSKERSIIGH